MEAELPDFPEDLFYVLYEDEFLKLLEYKNYKGKFYIPQKLLIFMINYRIITYVFGIILFLYLLNYFIYSTVGFSYYDFYLYYNKISNLNVDVIFFGHFQPIIFIYKIIDIIFGFHGLIILKSFF